MAMTGDDNWVDFAAGGGKAMFYNSSEVDLAGTAGNRMDGRDLIAEAADDGITVVQTKEAFLDIDFSEG